MKIGFVMLCHAHLDRAVQIARYWADRDCPIVIHVDSRVRIAVYNKMMRDLRDYPHVCFSDRFACEWGTWGLVAATQKAARMMLEKFQDVDYVYLVSGSCLPLRSLDELKQYLESFSGTDFIESVTTEDVGWTIGGLSFERFLLRFPFSWRKQRWLFDKYVDIQRLIKLKRKIPQGIVPHLGSQWWCLTRKTLAAILTHPQREVYDRYFKHVWIPDESYFQTLVRLVSNNIESRSLTLAKFDHQGKPHIFYDDHIQLLRKSDCFIARKIWPHADKLYHHFLNINARKSLIAHPNPGKINRLFSKAVEIRIKGRAGLYMQSCFPRYKFGNGGTAMPYSVFEGFSDLFDNFDVWLGKATGARAHGHLFAPQRVEYYDNATVYAGCLSDSAQFRDYNPILFLTNLIWNTRGERQCFQFGPNDNQNISDFMAHDPNAQISVITGAWAIPLFHQGGDFKNIRKRAAKLQQIEGAHIAILNSLHVKAKIRIWSLAEFIENPLEYLQIIIDEISPRTSRSLTELPRMAKLNGFGLFLQKLRNEGMQPLLMGDFPSIYNSHDFFDKRD